MIDSDLQGSQIALFCCHPNIRYITFVDAVNVKTLVKISAQLSFLTVNHYQVQSRPIQMRIYHSNESCS